MDTTIEKNKGQLDELITRLTSLVVIERIYCIEQVDGNNTRTGLIILISDKKNKVLSELTPIFNVVLADYPHYWYRAYFSYIVKDGIKKGNLFFYDTCRPENLLYTNPTSDFILIPEAFDINSLMDKAKRNFQKEMDKINAIKEGALFYYEKGNYPQTAFMVHQQIEITYRAIELFTLGKDKVTHSIRVHQDCVRPHMQDLGNVFNESNAEEDKLMRHLDDAYLAVRYEDGFQIRKEKIVLAIEKAELVYKMVNQIYLDMLKVFEDKHISGTSTEKDKAEEITVPNQLISENDLNSIVEKIALHKGAKRIYCFGKRTYEAERKMLLLNESQHKMHVHYDLLIITEENIEQELYNLQGMNNSEQNTDKFSFVVLTKKQVQKGLEMHQRFLLGALKNGLTLFSNGDDLAELLGEVQYIEQYSKKELDRFLVDWYNRYNNAESFIESANDLSSCESLPAQLSMFNQGLEQLCLGLLQVFIDYKPNRNSLGHLMDLCCSFLSFPEEIFPRTNIEDLELFSTLTDSFNKVRYTGNIDASSNELGIILKRCNLFLEKADEAARKKIKEMKEKQYEL
ncbi:HEPN domain-containing protein [Pedobacter caeni]|uniref:HEPN domain-containing protein n=1 Tax=Pedobacter caeni TaxID=288992 RepID=A0A1M5GUN2_9SPHI|nr:HEPN domain-containing protein [Pedobacter caeni]SHG07142.1 HEPN domain-containing protein [Pedobacter caeni]